MIPPRLSEKHPLFTHYKSRVFTHYMLGNRYFSPTIGYFTVVKVWSNAEFDPYWTSPLTQSHWRRFNTLKVVSDAGTSYILRKELLDHEQAFRKTYN